MICSSELNWVMIDVLNYMGVIVVETAHLEADFEEAGLWF